MWKLLGIVPNGRRNITQKATTTTRQHTTNWQKKSLSSAKEGLSSCNVLRPKLMTTLLFHLHLKNVVLEEEHNKQGLFLVQYIERASVPSFCLDKRKK